jgi:ppGpp synthetase/RelA/SpoT-type nucleotidyltranferase
VPEPPANLSPSRSQVKRLGSRLRTIDEPSVADLELLDRWRDAHENALRHVVGSLLEIGLEPTYRYKTTGTIIEKLRRNPTMGLLTMQDIVGVRVVEDATRSQQDRRVLQIAESFQDVEQIDRRAQPSFGYRAVHLVVKLEGFSVEVQVRTHLQDLWAQVMERLADTWGRQIRYGEPPDAPDHEVAPGVTRQVFVELLSRLSAVIDAYEKATARMERIDQVLTVDLRDEMAAAEGELRSLLADLQELA